MVIFSHGLGGNRATYAAHGAAYAAQVSCRAGLLCNNPPEKLAVKPKLLA